MFAAGNFLTKILKLFYRKVLIIKTNLLIKYFFYKNQTSNKRKKLYLILITSQFVHIMTAWIQRVPPVQHFNIDHGVQDNGDAISAPS